MAEENRYPKNIPPQKQEKHPGEETEMKPAPKFDAPWYKGANKLKDKVAIITGGDSGIGRSIAILFAREGAKVVIAYYDEDKDAEDTKKFVENEGSVALLVRTDLQSKANCKDLVKKTIETFGTIDILVNHAGYQRAANDIREVTEEQLDRTFRTNIYSMFFLTQEALEYMKEGSVIINTTSITAFDGNPSLLDYSSTKGACQAFTRALSKNLASKKIRVNAVAPGPIWTPFISSSFGKDLGEQAVKDFGKNTLLGRPGQPEEVAPAYVFLASQDSTYFTGQTLHPNGGK